MSDENQSYEDLVKRLKPLKIIVKKISTEKFAELKVISDPNRIKDEKPVGDVDDRQEEEFEVVLADVETKPVEQTPEEQKVQLLSCFFCKDSVTGYAEAFSHLQLHIDYYPIQCSICDEAITDLISFVKHCRNLHKELETAKYIKKFNLSCFQWIHDFLTKNPHELFKGNPHKYCPSCNWIHLSADVNSVKESSQVVKPLQVVRHVHEHLLYRPFQCMICKQSGKDYRIHVLDVTTRNHFLSDHPELANDGPFNRFFNKKFTITSLDKFIANYLTIFGLKVPKTRNRTQKPKKKPKAEAIPVVEINPTTGSPTIKLTNSSIVPLQSSAPSIANIKAMPTVIKQQVVTLDSLMFNTSQLQPVLINGQLKLLSIAPTADQMQSPLLIQPSNNHINASPFPVEATDIGIVCIDPKDMELEDRLFKYICVFCTDDMSVDCPVEFADKTEALIHYGIHFKYEPVVCMICEKRFVDLSLLTTHYNKDHNAFKDHLFHYLKEDERIEKWILSFLDFQRNFQFKGKVSALFGDFCFVCEILLKLETNAKGFKFKDIKSKDIRDHIYEHLHYFPFRCSICFHGGRDARFSAHNASASTHLLKFHGIDISDKILAKESLKLIVKCDEILDLEKFIDSKMFPKREKLCENPLVLNIKRKLEEIEIQNKKSRPSISTPLPSAQVIPIVRTVDSQYKSPLLPVLTYDRSPLKSPLLNSLLRPDLSLALHNSLLSPPKTNGITSSHRLTQKIAPKPTPIEVIPSKKTYIEPFLMCFHCHEKVLNATELESHHQKKHPKLTIASYTPNKADITSLARRTLGLY